MKRGRRKAAKTQERVPCVDCATVGSINGVVCRGCNGVGWISPETAPAPGDGITGTIW